MIATIIVIGLCLNLLVVLSIWIASKGLKESFRLLKLKLSPKSEDKSITLGSGTFEHYEYELKIAALEDQPAVSVFCPFPVSQVSASRSPSKKAFGCFKKLVTLFVKNVAISGFTKFSDHHSVYLPSVRGLEVLPVIEPRILPGIQYQIMQESSATPSHSSDSIPQDFKLEQPSKPHRQPRSKLAVKLERKLPHLSLAIEEAKKVAKRDLILSKIEKLERQLAKKLFSAGKSILNAVPEISSN